LQAALRSLSRFGRRGSPQRSLAVDSLDSAHQLWSLKQLMGRVIGCWRKVSTSSAHSGRRPKSISSETVVLRPPAKANRCAASARAQRPARGRLPLPAGRTAASRPAAAAGVRRRLPSHRKAELSSWQARLHADARYGVECALASRTAKGHSLPAADRAAPSRHPAALAVGHTSSAAKPPAPRFQGNAGCRPRQPPFLARRIAVGGRFRAGSITRARSPWPVILWPEAKAESSPARGCRGSGEAGAAHSERPMSRRDTETHLHTSDRGQAEAPRSVVGPAITA